MSIRFDPDDGLHMSAYPTRSKLWQKSKNQQRALVRYGRDSFPVLVYVLAAITVQRYWRGVLLRRRVLKHFLHGGFVRRWRQDEAVTRAVYRSIPKPPERELNSLISAVQARWRTALLRQEFLRWSTYEVWPIYYVAAATIQRAWVDFRYTKKNKRHRSRSKRMFLSREHAMAGRIQLAWRGFVQRQIFTFYKRLVQLRTGGDALLMLRAINASEAFLMDPGAGLHVRFRLAGETFPPMVLYKIYTHRPVADIGAFAPKDYTKGKLPKDAATINNTIDINRLANNVAQRTKAPIDKSTWYHRVENNDWRAVAESVFLGKEAAKTKWPADVKSLFEQRFARFLDRPAPPPAPQTQGQSASAAARSAWRQYRPSKSKFYAEATKRREVRRRLAKETQRRWLVELYAAEQETHSKLDRDTLREEARYRTAVMSDEELEQETAMLVQWTQALDYDAYYRDWLAEATTAPSDARVAPGSTVAGAHAPQ